MRNCSSFRPLFVHFQGIVVFPSVIHRESSPGTVTEIRTACHILKSCVKLLALTHFRSCDLNKNLVGFLQGFLFLQLRLAPFYIATFSDLDTVYFLLTCILRSSWKICFLLPKICQPVCILPFLSNEYLNFPICFTFILYFFALLIVVIAISAFVYPLDLFWCRICTLPA